MLLVVVFVLGYLAIASEQLLRLNKAASALLTGVLCWAIFTMDAGSQEAGEGLAHHLSGISGILFFLLGAMTIVELIDAHDGFQVITSRITTSNRRRLLLIVTVLTFFLSAVLDNLTTAIVMVSLVRKIVNGKTDRLFYAGAIIMAANAGGAWSPIGDVTTTMLWVQGQITSGNIILSLIIPSLVSAAVPLLIMSIWMKGNFDRSDIFSVENSRTTSSKERNVIFFTGVGVLLFVPVFKTITGLPPFMGVLFGLSILWSVTEIIHKRKDTGHRESLSVAAALQRIDTQSILFFLGILLAVGSLESNGMLRELSLKMNAAISDMRITTLAIGLASALVDNVPLVAAAQGMYPLAEFPQNHYFWEFLAYCAGTGGSILIIGSAAGVAAMGIEQIPFLWYLKYIAPLALAGYFAGALVYIGLAAI
ncbi:MAG TPA: sodium:proton antiporter NhaD [Bacteroidia bacterium]|nr:sodium:proton antiporter NhaD [Bacteroidia bacterium]